MDSNLLIKSRTEWNDIKREIKQNKKLKRQYGQNKLIFIHDKITTEIRKGW